jgi:hypothetical protein
MTLQLNDYTIVWYGADGPAIAKFANGPLIPDRVADHDTFVFEDVDRESLEAAEVDHSPLTDDERQLLSNVYPTS